jgi:hypothetical protein
LLLSRTLRAAFLPPLLSTYVIDRPAVSFPYNPLTGVYDVPSLVRRLIPLSQVALYVV